MRAFLHSLAFFFFFALVVVPASAQPATGAAATVQARQRFAEGVKYFDRGDYEQAVASFTQAYALKRVVDILRNLGVAEMKAGHTKDGARHLSEYLRSSPAIGGDEKAELKRELDKAERTLGRIQIRVDEPNAEISVDGESVNDWVRREPLHVDAGEHVVSVKKMGFKPFERRVVAAAGSTQIIDVDLESSDAVVAPLPTSEPQEPRESPPVSPPPTESRRASKSIVPLIVGGGIGVLALASGIGFRIAGSSTKDEAKTLDSAFGTDDDCNINANSEPCRALSDKYESADRKFDISTASFVVGGAALAATAVYYLWPQPKERRAHVRAVPSITAGDARLWLTGDF